MNKKGYPGDEAIVHSIENNDDSVLHWMYELCFPPVIKMVLQNNGNRDEASDLFQDAMVVFYENVKGGQFQLKSTISTYLYAVCRHLWLKKLREKGKSQMVYSDFDTHQEVSVEIKQFEDEELRFKKLSLAIEAIGEPCRGLLKDFYFTELSMVELASKYQYTNADNAKTQKYKCLQRLKKLFFK